MYSKLVGICGRAVVHTTQRVGTESCPTISGVSKASLDDSSGHGADKIVQKS